jgi:hypothetical protein
MTDWKDEQEKLPPSLRDLKQRGEGRSTPEGYFDGLEDAVFQKIEATGARRPAPAPVRRTLGRWWMAAAAAVLLGFCVWCYWPATNAAALPASTVTLAAEEAERYLIEHLEEFETDQLAMLNEAQSETTTDAAKPVDAAKPTKKTKKNTPDISTDDLENAILEMTDQELEEIL